MTQTNGPWEPRARRPLLWVVGGGRGAEASSGSPGGTASAERGEGGERASSPYVGVGWSRGMPSWDLGRRAARGPGLRRRRAERPSPHLLHRRPSATAPLAPVGHHEATSSDVDVVSSSSPRPARSTSSAQALGWAIWDRDLLDPRRATLGASEEHRPRAPPPTERRGPSSHCSHPHRALLPCGTSGRRGRACPFLTAGEALISTSSSRRASSMRSTTRRSRRRTSGVTSAGVAVVTYLAKQAGTMTADHVRLLILHRPRPPLPQAARG